MLHGVAPSTPSLHALDIACEATCYSLRYSPPVHVGHVAGSATQTSEAHRTEETTSFNPVDAESMDRSPLSSPKSTCQGANGGCGSRDEGKAIPETRTMKKCDITQMKKNSKDGEMLSTSPKARQALEKGGWMATV